MILNRNVTAERMTRRTYRIMAKAVVFFLLTTFIPSASAKTDGRLSDLVRKQQTSIDEVALKWNVKETAFRQEQTTADQYEDIWNFDCDRNSTLVTGTMNGGAPENVIAEFQQYYHGDLVYIYNGSQKAKQYAGQPYPLMIYRTRGHSAEFDCPMLSSLTIGPEDMVLLTGKAPLAMHGAVWSIQAETTNTVTVTAKVESYAHAPIAITMELDKAHGYLPQSIDEHSLYQYSDSHSSNILKPVWTAVYKAGNFVQVQGKWLPSFVTYNYKFTDSLAWGRTWKFMGSELSHVTMPAYVKGTNVIDFRLLGDNLSTKSVADEVRKKHNKTVSYKWSGTLPTIDTLQNMNEPVQRKFRRTVNWVVFLPGIFLLGFGFYWYRRIAQGRTGSAKQPTSK